jgi:hypothetical protein
VTAAAVLRAGDHAPVTLHGTPVLAEGCTPGEIVILLGYTSYGQPVTLTVSTLEWADDLGEAAREGTARGIVRGGMERMVTA